MSVIKKTPYVETMIKAYSTTTLNNLLTQLNSASANIVEAEFGNLPNDLVATCRFKLFANCYFNGILIREEDKPTHLIKYDTSKQDLVIYKLDLTNYKYEEVKEYLNINELRRVVNDALYDGVAITTGQSVLGALDTTDGDLDGELNEDGDLVLSIKDGIIPNVVANPTGNATAPLTKLEVGSTIYSIPDGVIFKYIGTTTTQLTDGATTNPITINSESITAVAGDVVFYGDDEFVFDGTTWEQFGSTGFANPMTTQGDLIVGGASGVANRLPKGTAGQVLKATASGVEWASDNEGMTNPMTASQDIIVGGNSGTPTRLAKGSNGYLLGVNTSGNLAYTNSLPILTTAPSSANTDGLKIVILSSDSGITKYNGYFYIFLS